MADLLVKLYDFEFVSKADVLEKEFGIKVFRPMTPDKSIVLDFVRSEFGDKWADECEAAFARQPVSCFVATGKDGKPVGFAAYEATCKNFFGPIGVSESTRKTGVGRELLGRALIGLKELGYAYAIIGGGSGKYGFYHKVCGAVEIADSEPGIYKDIIPENR